MSKLSKYIDRQELILNELETDFEEFKKEFASRKSRGYVNACLSDIEKSFKKAKRDHEAIVNSGEDPLKDNYFKNETFSKIKRVYFIFLGMLNDELEKFEEKRNANFETSRLDTTKSSVCDIRLPTIQIKPFSGKFEEWCEFHNLFESMIDQNVDLSDIQKLQYLKTSVSGDAARLIQHLPIDGKNYSSAWSILTERFQNKRKLVNTQLRILMEQQKLTHESADRLKSLHDTTTECIHALSNLGVPVEAWDCILVYVIYQKLPSQTQRDWEDKLGTSKKLPAWKQFLSFIEARFSSLENMLEVNGLSKQQVPTSSFRKATNSYHIKTPPANKQFLCRLCKASHGIRHCKLFSNMDVKTRAEYVKKNGICSNCLGYEHHPSACNSNNRCCKCGLKHHTMLHFEPQQGHNANNNQHNTSRTVPNQHNNSQYNAHVIQNPNQQGPIWSSEQQGASTSQHFNSHFNQMRSKALLATALVKVFASNGTHHVLRALIDPGSEATFVTENAVQLLNLRKQRTLANVTGLGQTSTGTANYQVEFTFFSFTNPLFCLDVRAFVFPQLTSLLPTHHLSSLAWQHLAKLSLADPSYNVPGKIDLLIGADVYASIILEGLIKGQNGSPVAQLTELGWILTGTTKPDSQSATITVQNHHNSLDLQLKEFWELEENLDERKLTEEEQKCQQHFQKTCQRRNDGRFEVQLPFKENIRPNLGNSKKAAMARFFQIERRLASSKKLRDAYTACISEYATLGHMQEVNIDEDHRGGQHYFLPHHAVFKESSSTTKLRVVFDASCKTSTGASLNDHLMVGPRLQRDIIDLIAQWRVFKVVMAADISMMYRQIWMAPKDTVYQLILWRSSTEESIKTYALNTVTFGTASAPYLAVRALQQAAIDVADTHPHVTKALTEGFYVDDFLYGSDNETDAIILQRDVLAALKYAGFPLRKWASNSLTILEQIPETEREVNLPLNFDSPDAIKTLGIQWHPAKDVFTFKIHLPQVEKYTKRSILADIARLFDPLGWISPCIIKAKLIMQQLWLKELSWDSSVTPEVEETWVELRNSLVKLEAIEVPRWVQYENASQVQLHGFSDASEKAYAAVVYARVVKNGQEHISLVASKTRVAPIKCVSLPRLELCAALLLAKLLHRMAAAMPFKQLEIFAWSDSMITIAWIRGNPHIRTTFVANRITEIQALTEITRWRHVGSKENPADIGSRGLSPEELIGNEMWWHGPTFLQNFCATNFPAMSSETECETKVNKAVGKKSSFYDKNLLTALTTFAQVVSHCVIIDNFFQNYSSLKRLIRCIAIWRRYINNVRCVEKRRGLNVYPLTAEELISSHSQLIKIVQNELFPDDIKSLKENKSIPKGSLIRNLNPFLDSDEILRVGGRLTKAPLPFSQRHPIILRESHHFSKLIVSDVHQRTLHGGQQMMMAEIRSIYWITNLKRLVKSTIHRCVRCHRYNARMQQQLMGSLPTERVMVSRPFTNTGVDYAGPVEIEPWKGRCNESTKGYIAVFLCLATKAIHIELVSDLSAAAFIAAFRRFIARRGICANMFSDCGTNFKGAHNELSKDSRLISTEWSAEVADTLASQGTTWHFNPPSSPHFGGLWEAGVKSIKHHLKRTIGSSKLTFEEYATLLTQIEACLNSRPLCPITSDPDDLTVLTPGHFLIGAPLRTLPDRNLGERNINCLDRWKYLQRLTQDFWKQWSTTYLHQLQQRPKWLQKEANIMVGDIVLMKEDNLPPSAWLLARVMELHPGSDGLTRVVTIKTEKSILKRPIAKLSPLPVCTPSNDP